MKNYQFFFILSGNLAEPEVPSMIEHVKKMVEATGAANLVLENKGKQRLAYPIGPNNFGYLINAAFNMEQEKVNTLQNQLKLDLDVVRFMITEAKSTAAAMATKVIAREPHIQAGENIPASASISSSPAKPVDLVDLDKRIDAILQEDNIQI